MRKVAVLAAGVLIGIALAGCGYWPGRGIPSSACRLPVSGPSRAGFVIYPGGQLEIAASVKPATDLAYSATANRWVRGSYYNLSPDGRSMAWLDDAATPAKLQIIDVASGRSRDLMSGDFSPIGWELESLYARTKGTSGPPRLYRIDVVTGRTELVANDRFDLVFQGMAWQRPSPAHGSLALVGLDLASPGSTTATWYSFSQLANGDVSGVLLGVDQDGRPIVTDRRRDGPSRVLLVLGPGSSAELATSDEIGHARPLQALGDSHGIWITTSDASLWLHRTDGSLIRVAANAGQVMAGPCI